MSREILERRSWGRVNQSGRDGRFVGRHANLDPPRRPQRFFQRNDLVASDRSCGGVPLAMDVGAPRVPVTGFPPKILVIWA